MNSYSLGCFGKLPIHTDFIWYNAEGDEVRGLDQWFQEGIHLAKSRWGQGAEAIFSRADAWNFVYYLDGADRFLIGVFIPSQDKGGRWYPFFIFLRVDRKKFLLPIYFAPLQFSAFLTQAMETAQKGWLGADHKTFLSSLKGMTFSVLGSGESLTGAYNDNLKFQTTRNFWTGVLGDFQDPRKHIIGQNLIDLFRPLRDHHPTHFGLGLKFPIIPHGHGEDYDIPFWFDLILHISGLKMVEPVFFWNRKPKSYLPYMIAFLHRPLPKNFIFLIRPEQEDDSWYDLACKNRSDSEAALKGILEERRKLQDNGDLSLAAFLEGMAALD